VIATELEIRIESLPRTAVAIFNAPTVAARAVELAGTDIAPDDLIPAVVQVNPLENTGVIEIDAQHPDPELAALYANSAGRALAEEMNLVGPGLGTFSLQIPAAVPEDAVEPSILPILAVSVAAAAVLVVGVAALAAMFSRQRGTTSVAPSSAPVATATGPANPSPAQSRPAPSTPAPRVVAERRHDSAPSASDGNKPHAKKKQPKPGEDDADELKVDELEPFVHHLDRIPRPAPIHPLASSAEQAYALMESISGVGPVFGARLAALGITKVSELAAADPKWVADAVEVRREVVIDWIRQAIGLHSELHDGVEDAIDGEDEAEDG
jgi:predicted flap endonuclease-1-like 5' DNA nuclease